ncbi:MAG: HD domain-containing protein [Planctomycetia bacterium]|nr:HD domain-containing protein [Planctomycetia bacterium]
MTIDQLKFPLISRLLIRSSDLALKAKLLIDNAHKLLTFSPSSFPSGTDHTATHTITVEQIAEMLLPESLVAKLTDEELFFLVLACHYHDLGMVGTVEADRDEEGRKQTRHAHALTIGERLKEHWQVLGFSTQREAEILGEVCRGHRPNRLKGVANWDDLHTEMILAPGVSIRTRLVAGLIYCSDELHLGGDRTPKLIEQYREVTQPDALKHWKRHGMISGPSILGEGRFTFDVAPKSAVAEEDLRANVFAKGLSARRDLVGLLKQSNITIEPRKVYVNWDRTGIWKSLITVCLASFPNPISEDELVNAVLEEWSKQTTKFTNLIELCQEEERDQTLDVRRAISKEVTKGSIDQNSKGISLSLQKKNADKFFELMREIDKIDELFAGRYRIGWETRLFESPFGRAYVEKNVLPAIERVFTVSFAYEPSLNEIRTILRYSPSAVRVAEVYQPSTSTVCKEELLRLAVITGGMYDLFNDTSRILEPEFRKAIWSTVKGNDQLETSLRWVEEMTLVGAYDPEQIEGLLIPSSAEQRAMETPKSSNEKTTIHFTQTIPNKAPAAATLMSYLVVASGRSGKPLTIAAETDGVLTADIKSAETEISGGKTIRSIRFAPERPRVVPSVTCPAILDYDEASNTIRFLLYPLSDPVGDQCPLLLKLPTPNKNNPMTMVTFTWSLRWDRMQIKHLKQIAYLNSISRSRAFRIESVLASDGRTIGVSNATGLEEGLFPLPSWLYLLLDALEGQDESLAIPIFVIQEELQKVALQDTAQKLDYWKEFRSSKKILGTAIVLQFATSAGKVYFEETLKTQPGRLFSAPRIDSPDISQTELEKKWDEGKEFFQLTSYYNKDIYELGEILRNWSTGDGADFPLHFSSSGSPPLYVKSMLSVTFHPICNTEWDDIQRVVFLLRPVNEPEGYSMEATYWESKGDKKRAELAREIADRKAKFEKEVDEKPQGVE